MSWRRLTIPVLVTLLVLGGPRRAPAADRDDRPAPPRVSFLDGDVSFWRPGADDWAPAQVNTPLAEGDSLYAGNGGNAEVQVGPHLFVRAGSDTELGVASLDNDLVQLDVKGGHAAVDARAMVEGQAIELDTPTAAFTIDRPGYYRVDVDDDRTTFVTRRGGEASVVPANGESSDIGADQQVTLEGTDNPELKTASAPDVDEWDRWNMDRTAQRPERPASAQYVPPDVAGTDDLDRNGEWREEPEYGHVWVPHGVAADWAPYSTGNWIWDPYYGWTWIDDAPWGWAPYHYGRWVYAGGVWGWAPGPVVVRPAYSPALVAFFGPVGVAVAAPAVSWVALGWGEPCVPWWGPVGFVGHAWWGGWGGPRVVNNVVIQRNTYVNVRNINVYKNVNVHNAVVGVRRDRFGQGRVEHVRLSGDEARRLRPIRGQLGIKPTPRSVVPREGRGIRPPDKVRARPVVATRQPHDPTPRLRAAGLNPGERPNAPVRVVQPARQRGQGARAPAAGGNQRGQMNEQRGRPAERNVAPPPPGSARGQRQRGEQIQRPAAPTLPRTPSERAPQGGQQRREGAGSQPRQNRPRAERPSAERAPAAPAPSRVREPNRQSPYGGAVPRQREATPQPPRQEQATPQPPRQEHATPHQRQASPRREAPPRQREAAPPAPPRQSEGRRETRGSVAPSPNRAGGGQAPRQAPTYQPAPAPSAPARPSMGAPREGGHGGEGGRGGERGRERPAQERPGQQSRRAGGQLSSAGDARRPHRAGRHDS